MTEGEIKRLAQEATQRALGKIGEELEREIMSVKMQTPRTEPPPKVDIPDDLPEYIRCLVTAPPGKEPRGNLGGGAYEVSEEMAAWIHWINYGWW